MGKNSRQLLRRPNRPRRTHRQIRTRLLRPSRFRPSKLHRARHSQTLTLILTAFHQAPKPQIRAPETPRQTLTALALSRARQTLPAQHNRRRRLRKLLQCAHIFESLGTQIWVESWGFGAVLPGCCEYESEWNVLVFDDGLLLCEGGGFLGEFVWLWVVVSVFFFCLWGVEGSVCLAGRWVEKWLMLMCGSLSIPELW